MIKIYKFRYKAIDDNLCRKISWRGVKTVWRNAIYLLLTICDTGLGQCIGFEHLHRDYIVGYGMAAVAAAAARFAGSWTFPVPDAHPKSALQSRRHRQPWSLLLTEIRSVTIRPYQFFRSTAHFNLLKPRRSSRPGRNETQQMAGKETVTGATDPDLFFLPFVQDNLLLRY